MKVYSLVKEYTFSPIENPVVLSKGVLGSRGASKHLSCFQDDHRYYEYDGGSLASCEAQTRNPKL